MSNKYKIYFASPFFNDEQIEREERLKSKLRDLGYNVWSPKENCNCPPDASQELRKEVFKANCKNINNSDIIFVVTDGKDIGTIWEAGYACGLNYRREAFEKKAITIIYYCETLNNNPFNLMLAQSGDMVITDFNLLEQKMKEATDELIKYEFTGNIE